MGKWERFYFGDLTLRGENREKKNRTVRADSKPGGRVTRSLPEKGHSPEAGLQRTELTIFVFPSFCLLGQVNFLNIYPGNYQGKSN